MRVIAQLSLFKAPSTAQDECHNIMPMWQMTIAARMVKQKIKYKRTVQHTTCVFIYLRPLNGASRECAHFKVELLSLIDGFSGGRKLSC